MNFDLATFRSSLWPLLLCGGLSCWADSAQNFRLELIRDIAAETISLTPSSKNQSCRRVDSYTKIHNVLSAECSTEPQVMAMIETMIQAFWNEELQTMRKTQEIHEKLDEMSELPWKFRLQLKLGAIGFAPFTLRQLREQSCRAYIREQLRCGAQPNQFYRVLDELTTKTE